MTCSFDWPSVLKYLEEGHTLRECSERYGFHPDAWYKAVRRGTIRPSAAGRRDRRQYDWAAVQQYYAEGHSYRECRLRFGFAAESWRAAVRRGDVVARPQRWPLERLLREGRCRKTIKSRLVDAGIFTNACSNCGLTEWQGKPLSIQLDHINGNPTDNRIENLRMLCPNCHSQTETFGSRNIVQRRSSVVQL
jgi:hypothetical protein